MTAGLAERLQAARGGRPAPAGMLDLVVEEVELPGGPLAVVRPAEIELCLERGANAPYWAMLWPSAIVLARRLAAAPPASGTRVLELGCGLALPSLAAARAGADVLATDAAPEATVLAAAALERAGLPGRTAVLEWAHPGPLPARAPIVLAADVLYHRANVDPLLALLRRVVAPGGRAVVADPLRPGLTSFEERARAAGWHVEAEDDEARGTPVRVLEMTLSLHEQ